MFENISEKNVSSL